MEPKVVKNHARNQFAKLFDFCVSFLLFLDRFGYPKLIENHEKSSNVDFSKIVVLP